MYAFKSQFPFAFTASWGLFWGLFPPMELLCREDLSLNHSFCLFTVFFSLCCNSTVGIAPNPGAGWARRGVILLCAHLSFPYSYGLQHLVKALYFTGSPVSEFSERVSWPGFPFVWVCSFCGWKHLLKQWSGDATCCTVVACLHCTAPIYFGVLSRREQGGNSV